MTNAEFMSGLRFRYTGHFSLLNGIDLKFDAEEEMVVIEDKNATTSYLAVPGPERFFVFMGPYGRIMIEYGECTLKSLIKEE